MEEIKSKSWIERIFCKHDYQPFRKNEPFFNLNGERVYYICTKCGKEGHSVFLKDDGNCF